MKLRNYIAFKIVAIIAGIIVTSFTLSQYATLIQHLIIVRYNLLFECCMVTGMMLFQYPFVHNQAAALKLDYYYNMLLVSLMGSMMLWPLLVINHFNICSDMFNLLYFFGVVAMMFFVHKYRVSKLRLPVFLSYTWVLYRFIILFFIL